MSIDIRRLFCYIEFTLDVFRCLLSIGCEVVNMHIILTLILGAISILKLLLPVSSIFQEFL